VKNREGAISNLMRDSKQYLPITGSY
jgi:hypothetical protein